LINSGGFGGTLSTFEHLPGMSSIVLSFKFHVLSKGDSVGDCSMGLVAGNIKFWIKSGMTVLFRDD
jgi:hypothetical protein